ncbi:penicillin-binding transpeptidase domain-containing protein [Leekyejoonella antrihumi]|uniref:Penicillin-binding protein n=1 Tax=Leekyejoonella antrihumi TaxID=1660198 RepID=A0A563E648_9MICO|nr:penicillin-binding transpeptidase domain-containing protein [Leekyejoonella antrihumi]TWP37996.1 hypothetical protein FGL98_04620 [Leekyejoonella antrihumi]
MSRRSVLAGTTAGIVIAAGVGGGVLWKGHLDDQKATNAATAAATTFAKAWSSGHLDRAKYAGTTPAAAAANFKTTTAALGAGPVTAKATDVVRRGSMATADIKVAWTMSGGQKFSWTDPINLVKHTSGWSIQVPDRSLWHPKLAKNDAFVVTTDSGNRGAITGSGGADIMANQTVYDVVINPVTATTASVQQLQQITSVTGLVGELTAAQRSHSQATIPVITYRAADYDARKSALDALAGVLTQKRQQPLAQTRTFGQPILGSVGPVTAQMIKQDPKYYHAGMYVGISGLQAQYEKTLAPKPGFTIAGKSHPSDPLFTKAAQNGTTVQTTLDPTIQAAAEKAVGTLKGQASALVAINIKTGGVLAVANGPSYGMERAITGQFAPGSTLKMATAYTWLSKGHSPSEKVNCPVEVSGGGQLIRNFEGESFPNPPFSKDFAVSCNTAFVNASKDLDDSDLTNGAKALGIGANWAKQLGYTGAYDGSIPVAKDATEKAVSAFGQGRTQVSPLALAVAASSLARGSYIPPALVTSPKQPGSRTPKPLNAEVDAQMKQLMRLPVTDPNGTATIMQNTPGGPIFAKTGTAEFIDNGQDASHAWLAGWQGNIAFCALVVKVPSGQGGGTVAAPVVKDFFTTLANES